MDVLSKKLLRDGNLVGLKTRPARALIGWMAERDAQMLLGIPKTPAKPLPEHVQRVTEARAAVNSKPPGVEQIHALSQPADELLGYLQEFHRQPSSRQYTAKGWTIQIANLQELCAVQPIVHLDYLAHSEHWQSLLQQASHESMVSLARITLPIANTSPAAAQFDPQNNSWIVKANDCDTRVVGHFSSPLEVAPGMMATACGFWVARVPSFAQVVRYRERYFLRDGYHRALALLQKGIAQIPVLFREIPEAQKLEVCESFPDAVILGPRPPLFPDYLRDDVAAAVSHLASQKTISVQAAETRSWGGF